MYLWCFRKHYFVVLERCPNIFEPQRFQSATEMGTQGQLLGAPTAPCSLLMDWQLRITHGNSWKVITLPIFISIYWNQTAIPFPAIITLTRKQGSKAASQHPNCVPILRSVSFTSLLQALLPSPMIFDEMCSILATNRAILSICSLKSVSL
jgi:hypothetical protein